MKLTSETIYQWLRENDPEKLKILWDQADHVRKQNVGDSIHLRGLLEISNYCSKNCSYCGINISNSKIDRYRMSYDEVINCVNNTVKFGYGTVVLQAGEDKSIDKYWIEKIISYIKTGTPLAVTLSLGERSFEDVAVWKKAGADRYLLRIETTDNDLFKLIHQSSDFYSSKTLSGRIKLLIQLKELGYEIGSGVMIGIPGQTYDSLANDICWFREMDLDMIGIGPYIPHPETNLGSGKIRSDINDENQVPNTELMTYKVIALSRLVAPQANIPSTTALATINVKTGRELGLIRGANVVMPNITPPQYRIKYDIYPSKACIHETADKCYNCMRHRIRSINRKVGVGHGARKR